MSAARRVVVTGIGHAVAVHGVGEIERQIAAHKTKSPNIDVAAFKDMTGVSRKYAIPLLEYLDRERVTKRVGDYLAWLGGGGVRLSERCLISGCSGHAARLRSSMVAGS